jgi:hypothetical protein
MPVTVHIDELNSTVTATEGRPPASAMKWEAFPWAADEAWKRGRCRAEWLDGRTASEGFDD